jgi:hypothetical protein
VFIGAILKQICDQTSVKIDILCHEILTVPNGSGVTDGCSCGTRDPKSDDCTEDDDDEMDNRNGIEVVDMAVEEGKGMCHH